jgi:hypothetical protein
LRERIVREMHRHTERERERERERVGQESQETGREIDVAYEAVIRQTQHSELKVWQPF